jgi:hypothetical protein
MCELRYYDATSGLSHYNATVECMSWLTAHCSLDLLKKRITPSTTLNVRVVMRDYPRVASLSIVRLFVK